MTRYNNAIICLRYKRTYLIMYVNYFSQKSLSVNRKTTVTTGFAVLADLH